MLNVSEFLRVNGSLTVYGGAEAINNPADKGFANGHLGNPACPFYQVAFFDLVVFSKNNGADIIFLKV